MKYLILLTSIATVACSGPPPGRQVLLTQEEAPGTCAEITKPNVVIQCENKRLICFGGK